MKIGCPTEVKPQEYRVGLTPIGEVIRTLDVDAHALPQRGQYDTLAGFLMVCLRRIPRRTDESFAKVQGTSRDETLGSPQCTA